MFDKLSGLAMGIVTFAVIIGVGSIVLSKFGDAVSQCGTGLNAENLSWRDSTGLCVNSTSSTSAASTSATTTHYLNTQLGTSGLAGWAPAIIAFAVGTLFLAYFMGGKGKRKA